MCSLKLPTVSTLEFYQDHTVALAHVALLLHTYMVHRNVTNLYELSLTSMRNLKSYWIWM